MDPVVIPALSALTGSILGGMSTFAASWFSQDKDIKAQALFREIAKREALYAEFLAEGAKRLAEAWGSEAVGPEVLAELYGQAQRMRLISSPDVVQQAQEVIRRVTDAYAAPIRTFEEARHLIVNRAGEDVLDWFSEACKKELNDMRPRRHQRRPGR